MLSATNSVQHAVDVRIAEVALARIESFTALESRARAIQMLSKNEIEKAKKELDDAIDRLTRDGENTGILLNILTSQSVPLSRGATQNPYPDS
jgi:hypothetical protein